MLNRHCAPLERSSSFWDCEGYRHLAALRPGHSKRAGARHIKIIGPAEVPASYRRRYRQHPLLVSQALKYRLITGNGRLVTYR